MEYCNLNLSEIVVYAVKDKIVMKIKRRRK